MKLAKFLLYSTMLFNMFSLIRLLAVLILIVTQTSCATIVDGGDKFVSVNVEPSNAKVHVKSNKGEDYIRQGSFNLRVDRKASYTLVIESPDYISEEIVLKRGLNGWIFGNIVFGGIIGVIIDSATGNMWTPKPKIVSAKMVRKGSSNNQAMNDQYPDEVIVEFPIRLQLEDGSSKVVVVPIKFTQKEAVNGSIA